jgi:protein tyrosine phosphatase (PTP) superfamily phosphohydrolase (DUF442 family)
MGDSQALDPGVAAPGLKNASQPLEGVGTAGQPEPRHLEQLADAGYRTILDLRGSDEDRGFDERAKATDAGLTYLNIPVGKSLPDGAIDRVRAVLADTSNRPLLVHCGSASRVGGSMIPYLVLDEGMDPEEAVRKAKEIGLASEDLERDALDYVERHGGGRSG